MNTFAHSYARALFLVLVISLALSAVAMGQVTLTQLSQDTFTDVASEHASEVEPSAFTYGSTIVTAIPGRSHL